MNIIKNTKKDSEKKHVKHIKIFLNKKKTKCEKKLKRGIKILMKKKKKKSVNIFVNVMKFFPRNKSRS